MKNNMLKIILSFSFSIIFSSIIQASVWPIKCGQADAPLTSPFGSRLRQGTYDFHAGVDIRNLNDSMVVASHDGYADWIGNNGAYGLMIFIGDASYSYASGYAHLTSRKIDEDDLLLEGFEIAGCSRPNSDHLHFNYYTRNVFTLYQGSHPIDSDTENPMGFLPFTNNQPPGPVMIQAEEDQNIFFGDHHILCKVETPGTELDFNTISITLKGFEVDTTGDTTDTYEEDRLLYGGIGADSINFNARYNCGDDVQETLYHYIGVYNFIVGNNQTLDFRFRLNSYWQRCRYAWGAVYVWDTGDKDSSSMAILETAIIFDLKPGPTKFILSQNYPNPFNPQTKINYQLYEQGQITLKIVNLLGHEVRTLIKDVQPAGYYDVTWDGKNNNGQDVASGIYIYHVEVIPLSGNHRFTEQKRMTLVR